MPKPRNTGLRRQILTLEEQCGGEQELARLLHVTVRTVWSYRGGRSRPIPTVCLQLARICRTLDPPGSPRTDPDWWRTLSAEETP